MYRLKFFFSIYYPPNCRRLYGNSCFMNTFYFFLDLFRFALISCFYNLDENTYTFSFFFNTQFFFFVVFNSFQFSINFRWLAYQRPRSALLLHRRLHRAFCPCSSQMNLTCPLLRLKMQGKF